MTDAQRIMRVRQRGALKAFLIGTAALYLVAFVARFDGWWVWPSAIVLVLVLIAQVLTMIGTVTMSDDSVRRYILGEDRAEGQHDG